MVIYHHSTTTKCKIYQSVCHQRTKPFISNHFLGASNSAPKFVRIDYTYNPLKAVLLVPSLYDYSAFLPHIHLVVVAVPAAECFHIWPVHDPSYSYLLSLHSIPTDNPDTRTLDSKDSSHILQPVKTACSAAHTSSVRHETFLGPFPCCCSSLWCPAPCVENSLDRTHSRAK